MWSLEEAGCNQPHLLPVRKRFSLLIIFWSVQRIFSVIHTACNYFNNTSCNLKILVNESYQIRNLSLYFVTQKFQQRSGCKPTCTIGKLGPNSSLTFLPYCFNNLLYCALNSGAVKCRWLVEIGFGPESWKRRYWGGSTYMIVDSEPIT